MNFDIRPLVHPSYWLTLEPPTVWQGSGRFVVVLFLGMLVASFIVRRYKPSGKNGQPSPTTRRAADMLATLGGLALVLFFFSFEQIRVLGARFFYLVWMLGLVAWIVGIIVLRKREARAAGFVDHTRVEREKYLPRPKK